MNKLAIFAGVLITLSVLTQSCNNPHKIQRPQVHSRPPKQMAYVQPPAAANTAIAVIG